MRFVCSEGLRIEPLDESWAAYCARSGETLQLNTEAAAVLEVLSEGPQEAHEVLRVLAQDSQTPLETVSERMRDVWSELLDNGLVVQVA